jgi:hypothetical protein
MDSGVNTPMEWANPPRTRGAALNRPDPPLNSHIGIRIGRRMVN